MSPVTIRLDAQFGTPYPRSTGFDTVIGAFIESYFALSIEGSIARLVINADITFGRTLTPAQVLQLGGFTMGACSAIKPTAAPTIAKHHLRIGLEHSEKMDPKDVSSLNELLDHITALGVATDYDQIGLKPDQREIKSPPITHLVAVVEEQAENTCLPKLRTSYVRISEPCVSDTHL